MCAIHPVTTPHLWPWSLDTKHTTAHCYNFSVAKHALGDNQGCLPDNKQQVTTPIGHKNVIRWVIERQMLGQYQRAWGLLNPLGPPSPAKNKAGRQSWYSKRQLLQGQQIVKQEEKGFYSPVGFLFFM
jgi:hypothetical protein